MKVLRGTSGHHPSHRLNAQRQWDHIEEHDSLRLLLSTQYTPLHRRPVGHRLVGVDATVGLLAVEEVLEQLLHLGDAGGPPHQDHLVHLVLLQLRVVQHALHGHQRLLEQIVVQLLELGARQRLHEVLALVERLDLDLGLVLVAQLPLRSLHLAPQLLDRSLVLGRVLARLLLPRLQEEVHHALVKVLASQVRVSVRRNHLEHSVVDRQHRHVERAASQIEDQDVLLAPFLIKTVGDRSRSGFVDDAQYVKAGDGSSVLGGLALGIVEVGGARHNSVLNLAAQVRLCSLLHLGEHHG